MIIDVEDIVRFKNELVDSEGNTIDVQILKGRVYQIDSFGIYVVDGNEDCYVIDKNDIVEILR